MPTKTLIVDRDDTLIDDIFALNPGVKKFLRYWRRQGIYIAMATADTENDITEINQKTGLADLLDRCFGHESLTDVESFGAKRTLTLKSIPMLLKMADLSADYAVMIGNEADVDVCPYNIPMIGVYFGILCGDTMKQETWSTKKATAVLHELYKDGSSTAENFDRLYAGGRSLPEMLDERIFSLEERPFFVGRLVRSSHVVINGFDYEFIRRMPSPKQEEEVKREYGLGESGFNQDMFRRRIVYYTDK